MVNIKWKSKDVDKLIELFNDHISYDDIAKFFNVNKRIIYNKCNNLNLKRGYRSTRRLTINIGDKQNNGFLEVVELLPHNQIKCLCHNCNGFWSGSIQKFVSHNTKSCGCKKYYKYCKKCKHKNTLKNSICINCGYKFNKNSNSLAEEHPEILSKWDYNKNSISPYNITSGSHKRIWWICESGHSWQIAIDDKVRYKINCPYCDNKKVLMGFNDFASHHQELCIEWDYDKNYFLPSEIVSNHYKTKIYWICNKCGYNWIATAHSRVCGKRGCPKCNQSKGEKEISRILNKYNINNKPQYIFEECKNINSLKFDFYLPNHNICIEFQGIWHYIPHWSDKGVESLKNSKKRDKIKKRFCQKKNIKLIEIPYLEFDNIETKLIKELSL